MYNEQKCLALEKAEIISHKLLYRHHKNCKIEIKLI